jgi:predicted amidohydrolase
MRLAFAQTSPRLGLTRANLGEAYSLIERVRDADLVVLPELFHSGYAVRNREEAESLAVSRDETSEPLTMCLDAARSFRMWIAGGFLERASDRLYNSAWLVGPDGISAVYRKVHLFDREWDIFQPGDKPSPIAKVDQARVGMQICFDWVFPESWGRLAWGEGDGTGAQIIAHPVNLVIPDACPVAIRARALENRIFIVSAGRVGTDPGPEGPIEFRAGSRIVAPNGEVLAMGPDDRPGCDMVTVDPELANDKFLTPRDNILLERFGEAETSEQA